MAVYMAEFARRGGADDIFGSSKTQPHLFIYFHPSHLPHNVNMSVVEISSKEQFTSLLSTSRLVVADCKSSGRYPADPVYNHPNSEDIADVRLVLG